MRVVVLGLDQRAKHEAAGAWLIEASEPTTLGRGVFAQRGRDPCIYTGWRSLHPRSYVCVVIIGVCYYYCYFSLQIHHRRSTDAGRAAGPAARAAGPGPRAGGDGGRLTQTDIFSRSRD